MWIARRRRWPALALGLAALASVATVSVSAARFQEQSRLEVKSARSGIWLVSQALVEFHRLRAATLEFALGTADAEDVGLRFEILLSRLNLLGERGHDEDGEFNILESTRLDADAILAMAGRVEAALAGRLAAPAAADAAPLAAAMEALGERLAEANLEQHIDRRAALSRQAEGKDALRWTLVLSLTTLVASVAILVLMLAAESRRARRSLAQVRAARDEARHMAEHDALTGLPNRAGFAAALEAALGGIAAGATPAGGKAGAAPAGVAAGGRAGDGGGLALHCLDLDRFKEVNDGLGHPAGDRLLLAAVARMRGCLRRGDLLARLGGDEFAVVQHVPAAAGAARDEAALLAARLVEAMAGPFRLDGCTILSGVSIGTALAPLHGDRPDALLQRADIALYRAKGDGRGRGSLFEPGLEAALAGRRALEADLREALVQGGLWLAYQPKFALPDLRPTGVEALLRWSHPTRGAISPAVFVPVAEEAGLMAPLTRFALLGALRQARAWEAEGLRVPVAVNLSAQHFAAGQALPMIREALAATGADPTLLEVEVTEGLFIRNADAAAEVLREVRAMGVRVALDDFGTGYSSLGYLQRLPVDTLKVDRMFVSSLRGDDPRAVRIVEAVVRLAQSLGARVVAEGVERPEELRVLAALGCDEVQGFLLARPGRPHEIAGRFAARAAAPPPRAVAHHAG